MVEINPEMLKVFGFWGSILALKMLAMSILTARQRFRKQVFANPEDTGFSGKKAKIAFDDPDVERIRRAHLNDLESIIPWFITTYLWLSTAPAPWLARILIRVFVLSRITHTLSYAVIPQQPTRAIAFFVGHAITGYQAIATLLHYT